MNTDFNELKDTVVINALNVAIENTYSGFIVIDINGKGIYLNDWASSFLNLEKKGFSGQDVDELFNGSKLKKIMLEGGMQKNILDKRHKKPIIVDRFTVKKGGMTIGAIALFREKNYIEETAIEIRKQLIKEGLIVKYEFSDIITQDFEMNRIIELAGLFAKTDSTILITGESGTGKEMFAQSIHSSSNRSDMPFVALNCSTLTESILESELFGYADSSFTGAKKGGRMGLFQLAHNGTIFLDEIGEIPLNFQIKLLRVLQEQQIRPIGSNRIIPINVRVIAATNKDLKSELKNGRFRLDLFYRLNVLPINIPPLRERIEDINKLTFYFFKKHDKEILYNYNKGIINEIIEHLKTYNFPGNVRELENIVERIIIMLENNLIYNDKEYIIKKIIENGISNNTSINYLHTETTIKKQEQENEQTNIKKRLEQKEKQVITECLLKYNGNKNKTAIEMGISISTLYRKIKLYGIK